MPENAAQECHITEYFARKCLSRECPPGLLVQRARPHHAYSAPARSDKPAPQLPSSNGSGVGAGVVLARPGGSDVGIGVVGQAGSQGVRGRVPA
jgi:hypothetical protein